MFEDLMNMQQGGDNPLDVLNKLIESDKTERITDVNDEHIKTCCHIKWFKLSLDIEDKRKPIEKLLEVIEYYLELRQSYKRQSRTEIVKAISEMGKMIEPQEGNIGLGNMIK